MPLTCTAAHDVHRFSRWLAGPLGIALAAVVFSLAPAAAGDPADAPAPLRTGDTDETPVQAFERSRAAAKADSEKLVSAIGTGEFSVFMQRHEENEPKLQSQAKVYVYFDRGKYHVQVTFEKRLQQFSTTANGKTTVSTDEGRGDEARIIADEDTVYVVNFSKRTATNGDIFSREQEQAGFAMSGFGFNEPARLWKKFPDLDQIAIKAGAEAIAFSDIGDGCYRARYPWFKPYMAELDVDRSAGFHVTAFRVFNPDRKEAAAFSNVKATWRRANDTWYVNEYVQEVDTRGSDAKFKSFSRSVFKYKSFDVNVKVEPHLFDLKSFEIPVGTRFTDRRQKDALQVLYWNGTALQPERP
jgi:hypothetical protein